MLSVVTTLHAIRATTSHSNGLASSRTLYAVPERLFPRAAYVPAGRSLHLVDVENLMGGPELGDTVLRDSLAGYRASAPVFDGDHVIIGANPQLGLAAKTAWPGARLVVRGGPDGADIPLLEAVRDVAFIAARYDQIVVGSGDGAFEVVVREFRSRGLAVGVVSLRRGLSYALGTLASFVRLMPEIDIEVAM
jgi:hypothetical protein